MTEWNLNVDLGNGIVRTQEELILYSHVIDTNEVTQDAGFMQYNFTPELNFNGNQARLLQPGEWQYSAKKRLKVNDVKTTDQDWPDFYLVGKDQFGHDQWVSDNPTLNDYSTNGIGRIVYAEAGEQMYSTYQFGRTPSGTVDGSTWYRIMNSSDGTAVSGIQRINNELWVKIADNGWVRRFINPKVDYAPNANSVDDYAQEGPLSTSGSTVIYTSPFPDHDEIRGSNGATAQENKIVTVNGINWAPLNTDYSEWITTDVRYNVCATPKTTNEVQLAWDVNAYDNLNDKNVVATLSAQTTQPFTSYQRIDGIDWYQLSNGNWFSEYYDTVKDFNFLGDNNVAQFSVLGYHDFADDSGGDPYKMTFDLFSNQMSWLQDGGFYTLTLREAIACLETNHLPNVPNVVLVTFDDYYNSWQPDIMNIMKNNGVNGAFFPRVDFMDDSVSYPNAIPDLATLKDNGFDIGSHTIHHYGLSFYPYETNFSELSGSKQAIDGDLSQNTYTIAYPYGSHSWRTLLAAKNSGYKAGISFGTYADLHPSYLLNDSGDKASANFSNSVSKYNITRKAVLSTDGQTEQSFFDFIASNQIKRDSNAVTE